MTAKEYQAYLSKPTTAPAVVGLAAKPPHRPARTPPRHEHPASAPTVPLAAARLATGPQCPVRYCVADGPLRREQFPDTFRMVVEGPTEWLAAVEAALQRIEPPA